MNTRFENNYVYLLKDQNGEPFYVGIGAETKRCKLGFRIEQHIREGMAYYKYGKIKKGECNIEKLEKIKEILGLSEKVDYDIVAHDLSRDEANDLEIALIQKYGRKDMGLGPLLNKNNGGSGSKSPSVIVRQRIGDAHRGKIVSNETRQKQSEARKGRVINDEWRAKISKSTKGKPHSKEHNAKVGQSTKNRWRDENYRCYMQQRIRRKWLVIFPDGREEIHHGLQDILAQHPELKMSSLSQSGNKGKPYKGFIAKRIN